MPAMRRSGVVLPALFLVSCRTVSNEKPNTTASAAPPIAPVVDAAPPPPIETALAWGTRPPKTGELFPVVDGMCIHGEVWPTKGSALFTYGSGNGAFSRGGETTWSRLVDDGIAQDVKQGNKPDGEPYSITGTWPAPLFMEVDNPSGRMRAYTSVWSHDEKGWNLLGGPTEPGEPNYDDPFVYKGFALSPHNKPIDNDHWEASQLKTWPVDKAAPPIPGLGALSRAGFAFHRLAGNDTTLYALGYDTQSFKPILRWLTDGKPGEIGAPEQTAIVGATATALVVTVENKRVEKLENGKLAPIAFKLATDETVHSSKLATNGDVWVITSKDRILVAHGDAIAETQLPAGDPVAKEDIQHWPMTGAWLAGIDVDDPWAIAAGGRLFHFVDGQWGQVAFPKPPFSTQGTYRAQTVSVLAKGDVYVNAGYAEKGIGWKTSERYRAILRTKRPKETLRCNEPEGGSTSTSGDGFMSFPPIADDACTTPVAILVRVAWNLTHAQPSWKYDKKSDYPSVREAIKDTPSLGKTVDLIEVESGNQRYLAAPVPSVAAGKELGLAVVKRIKDEFLEIRPEVVCGTPKPARVLRVDVATGKPVTTP